MPAESWWWAKGTDGKAYVLADHSVKGRSPEGWASAVSAAALTWGADRVVAEANNGGDMVVTTLQAADVTMPVKKVSASRGKVARAEPVAMLYEAGKAFHIGAFPELEDELCGLISGGGYEGPGRSPDRADALVWAMSELMLGKRGAEPRIRSALGNLETQMKIFGWKSAGRAWRVRPKRMSRLRGDLRTG